MFFTFLFCGIAKRIWVFGLVLGPNFARSPSLLMQIDRSPVDFRLLALIAKGKILRILVVMSCHLRRFLKLGLLCYQLKRALCSMTCFEGWRGFTEPRRSMNFDTGRIESGVRNDILIGLRAGWTLHLYKRMSDNYFYY